MMKTLKLVGLFSLVGVIGGCHSVSQLNQMRTSETPAYSCPQIYAAFKAYDADRQSATAIAELSGMVNVNSAEAGTGNYYQRAKMAANIALIAQGCEPLS
ncbi:hypothetical protein [Aliikangiella coralliicola]|uniref:Lipoprotein n=1 Tax=Aliikangiella coralliicola TaxID=2592383 RepID=A0A545UJD3_9GAMM|nr:hypothetical protein [Aliikangiella coralliicola]TQV89571.1 hypothetical protein FLL46_01415 [Aliikangiella coralliicola]